MGKSNPIAVLGGNILQLGTSWLSQFEGEAARATHSTREAAEKYLARQQEKAMKVKTKASGKKATVKTAAKASAAKPAAGKRAAAKMDIDKQRKDVAARLKKGEKFGEIAEALHITPGRAKYLQMLNEVESGVVARISTSGNDEAIAKRIIAARNKQDEYSSWGYISARAGIPEARVKALAEAHGGTVKGTHVAKERAAAKQAAKPAKPAKAAKAKAGKGKAANPSK